jgi:hypothetical protein
MKKIFALAALIVIAIIAGCSSTPANATSILKGNGYTPISVPGVSGNAIPASDTSSWAVGVSNSNSSQYEFVVVLTALGTQQIAGSSNSPLTPAIQSEAAADGVTITESGNVLVVAGTASAIASLPF